MPKHDRFTRLNLSSVHWLFTDNHTNKGRLADPVFPDDTDTLVVTKFMREVSQKYFLSETFFDMFEFENFGTKRSRFYRER
jgi:hypothetical protein